MIVDLQSHAPRQAAGGQEPDAGPDADGARSSLAERGYDPAYGAGRSSARSRSSCKIPLARRIISGDFQPGDKIRGDRKGEEIVFGKVLFSGAQDNEAA